MVVGENNVLCLRGSKESDHLLILLPRGRGREGILRGEDSAAIFAVQILTVNWNGTIEDLDLELA